ncbi:enoyl-CoA-hydratase DpgB [Mycobacterium sp. Z3061]|uniref:enoyl-CoA-hydratase DpgB n=1 Tax=Mycobacterium sp. Z3061 TaxID=3073562 RepID=UPI002872D5FC|nr:enoyl-CoA-hydratase DpgB [Mycobacterium sp. Z3061]
MIEPPGQRADSFTLPAVDLAGRSRALSDFIRSLDSGLAVIDLREAGLEHLSPGDGIGEVSGWERALRLIERSSAATVALFGNQVGGSALEIGLACDFRIAGQGSQVIWRNDGAVWPSTALFRLVQLIGPAQTTRLTLLGEPVPAGAALVCGLVDVVTDNPEAEVETLRTAVSKLDDLRVVRQLLAEAAHSSYDDALGAHLAACERYLRRRGVE